MQNEGDPLERSVFDDPAGLSRKDVWPIGGVILSIGQHDDRVAGDVARRRDSRRALHRRAVVTRSGVGHFKGAVARRSTAISGGSVGIGGGLVAEDAVDGDGGSACIRRASACWRLFAAERREGSDARDDGAETWSRRGDNSIGPQPHRSSAAFAPSASTGAAPEKK